MFASALPIESVLPCAGQKAAEEADPVFLLRVVAAINFPYARTLKQFSATLKNGEYRSKYRSSTWTSPMTISIAPR